MSSSVKLLVCAFVLSLAACVGGADSGTGDGGAGSPDLVASPDLLPLVGYPAPHPVSPQVTTMGGAVLLAPRIVPVFFSNDDPAIKMQLIDFANRIGSTKYWKAVTQEYDGIGPATATAPVQLTETATGTIADSAVQTWLAGKLNGNDPAFPKPDENTVYVIHYPDGVTITSQGFFGATQSCQDFGGYHGNITLDARHSTLNVAYAVIPRCASFGGMTGIDVLTATESHELAEAASDPYPMSNPAYGQVDADHVYWAFILGGGENGDMCAQDPRAFTKFPELPYTVQRIWSNQAAMAGHDPCVPALPGEVYFNSVPELNDSVTVGAGNFSFTMLGVQIPVGQSKTVTLDLFSDGPTSGPWNVRVQDAASLMRMQPTLSFMLDKNTGKNGDKLQLTIKTLRASQFHAGVFFITSSIGAQKSFCLGLVGE